MHQLSAAGLANFAIALRSTALNGGPVAVHYRLGRHVYRISSRYIADDGFLVATETEQLVFDNRAADGAAVLIAVQRVPACRGRKEILRIQRRRSHEFKQIAVVLVASLLGDH